MRNVLNAILYLVRTGCQWCHLPKDFPPKSTVWGYFDEWRHNGTLDTIHDRLRDRIRRKEKPGHPRHTASLDSQSVDTSSGGEAPGRDNAKMWRIVGEFDAEGCSPQVAVVALHCKSSVR